MVGRGENQRAASDAGDTGIGVGLGEDHGARGGLVQADRAGENHVDRAVAQVEGGGGSQHTGGSGDDAALERDGGDRVVEGRDIQNAAREGHVAGVREDVVGAENEGADVDGRTTGEGIGSGKRKRTGANLGEAARGVAAIESHGPKRRLCRIQ